VLPGSGTLTTQPFVVVTLLAHWRRGGDDGCGGQAGADERNEGAAMHDCSWRL